MWSWLCRSYSWLFSSSEPFEEAARVPIEALERFEHCPTFIAGGAQTRSAISDQKDELQGVIFSNRGRRYAAYNEDAGMLFWDEAGRMYAAVFDQAGGLGGVVRGEASKLAAEHVALAFKTIASNDLPPTQWSDTIIPAFKLADQKLRKRNANEVTTAVAAVVDQLGHVCVVTSGDSGAMRYNHRGVYLGMTSLHMRMSPEGITYLESALGLAETGPKISEFQWQLSPGDTLLLCTDGLLDAGLSQTQLGIWITGSGSLLKAINQTTQRILRRMQIGHAKPDNLTMVAIQRKDHI